jgi:hypothetical protein
MAAYCNKCGKSALLLGQSNLHFCVSNSNNLQLQFNNDDPQSQFDNDNLDTDDLQFDPGKPINECATIVARRIYLPALLAGYNDFRAPVRSLAGKYRTTFRTVGEVGNVIASMVSVTGTPSPSELAWEKLQLEIFDLADFHLTPDQMIRKFDDLYRKRVK